MHARYFPAHFRHPEEFREFRARLFQGGIPGAGWKNFFRRTDYVGQRLFEDATIGGEDCELPDPPKLPRYRSRPTDQPWPVPPDAPPPIFTKMVVHSFYNNSVELRTWVDALQEWLRSA
jgi:hypothetical protein